MMTTTQISTKLKWTELIDAANLMSDIHSIDANKILPYFFYNKFSDLWFVLLDANFE